MRFETKVALVTGAGSGIGEATAKLLAARGAEVVVADLAEDQGLRVVSEIKAAGGEASFIRTDVSDEVQVQAMVDFAVSTYGGLHVAYNNAGIIQHPGSLHELDAATWRKVVDIDLTAVFLCMKAEIVHMLAHGGGAIVNTASGAGLKAAPGLAAYTAAKHGVVGLTRTAGLDYAGTGIRVNAIAPGTIETSMVKSLPSQMQEFLMNMVPIKRVGKPEEVAELVAFLLSDAASYITAETVAIDGAFTQSSKGM